MGKQAGAPTSPRRPKPPSLLGLASLPDFHGKPRFTNPLALAILGAAHVSPIYNPLSADACPLLSNYEAVGPTGSRLVKSNEEFIQAFLFIKV